MRWQDSKCINCGRKSDITVHTLISMKNRKPRAQKTSKAIPLCALCIRSLKISHVTQVYTTVLLTLKATHAELAKQL
jgi:hypothetical protein